MLFGIATDVVAVGCVGLRSFVHLAFCESAILGRETAETAYFVKLQQEISGWLEGQKTSLRRGWLVYEPNDLPPGGPVSGLFLMRKKSSSTPP